MVAGGKQCASRLTITATKTYIYRRIKEGWGTHLNEHTARGTWSLPENKIHINYLELKAVFLALCECHRQHHSRCLHKQRRGMKSGSLCALLWRIHLVFQKTGYSQSPTHSRLGQTIQTEWSLLSQVFQAICIRWHQPQTDLFATRFSNKLAQSVSPVSDPLACAVDSLSLPWENLGPKAFPLVAIVGKVLEKLQDYPCRRIILTAPGWPNMPWFWDIVTMSSQIPLYLPNLLTQPFNQTPHRNLSNLNLHAWCLGN